MQINELYSFVLLIVLVGMILGVGILVLDNFADSANNAAAEGVITNTSASLGPIASTWLPLIVTVSVLAIILTLVIRAFANRR